MLKNGVNTEVQNTADLTPLHTAYEFTSKKTTYL